MERHQCHCDKNLVCCAEQFSVEAAVDVVELYGLVDGAAAAAAPARLTAACMRIEFPHNHAIQAVAVAIKLQFNKQ